MSLMRHTTRGKRKLGHKPVVEPLESRALLSADRIAAPTIPAVRDRRSNDDASSHITLVSPPPYAGEPWSPVIKYEKYTPETPDRRIGVTLYYGDSPDTAVTHITLKPSGKRFVLYYPPEHTYQNPGQYNFRIYVDEHGHSHERTYILDIPSKSPPVFNPSPPGDSPTPSAPGGAGSGGVYGPGY